jgi:hypothetical protein
MHPLRDIATSTGRSGSPRVCRGGVTTSGPPMSGSTFGQVGRAALQHVLVYGERRWLLPYTRLVRAVLLRPQHLAHVVVGAAIRSSFASVGASPGTAP